MPTTTITVTEQHIKQGIARSCKSCPVALAIRDVLLPDMDVQVGIHATVLSHKRNGRLVWFDIALPRKATRFIESFDSLRFDTPSPILFEMCIPDECLPARLMTTCYKCKQSVQQIWDANGDRWKLTEHEAHGFICGGSGASVVPGGGQIK